MYCTCAIFSIQYLENTCERSKNSLRIESCWLVHFSCCRVSIDMIFREKDLKLKQYIVEVVNSQINIWLASSLVECQPAIPSRDISVSGCFIRRWRELWSSPYWWLRRIGLHLCDPLHKHCAIRVKANAITSLFWWSYKWTFAPCGVFTLWQPYRGSE